MSLRDATGDRVGTLRIQSSIDDRAVRRTCRTAVAATTLPRRSNQILVLRSVTVDVTAVDDTTRFRTELSERVADGWTRARRPTQTGAGRTDAVVFRDHVELLVHYLIDLAGGRVGQRWWWATVGDLVAPTRATPAEVLVAHASDVPAAIVELDRIGCLDVVLSPLDGSAVRRVLAAVAEAYALSSHTAASARLASARNLGADERDTVVGARSGTAVDMTPTAVLVGLARLLVTDLAAARAPQMIQQVAATIGGVGSHRSDAIVRGEWPQRDRTPVSGADRSTPDLDVSRSRRHEEVRRVAESTGDRSAEATALPDGRAVDRRAMDDPATPSPAAAHDLRGRSDAANHLDEDADRVEHRMGSRDDADATDPMPSEPSAELREPSVGSIRTDLAGVLFLIAPLLELRVTESFGRHLDTKIGWWGTLELLARSLVRIGPGVERDPIWEELASLNGGRSAIDRARALRPADLQPSPQWAADGDPPTGLVPMANTAASTLTGTAMAWLAHVRGRVAGHLCDRLGVAASDLDALLIHRTAALAVDRTHVEVFFPLDAAHLAVRRAGFDRDPGWVPELGRVVLFHFGAHDAHRAVET